MQSPVKEPSTRNAAPTSGALAPLRARHTISSALPSLSAMATPEALVKAWARCATTARSSGEAPRALLFAVLLAVSEAWVAMCTPSLKLYFLTRCGPKNISGKCVKSGGNKPLDALLYASTNPASVHAEWHDW
jgi:hypothetical protein